MKYLGLIFLLGTLSACTHTIKFRASHFAVPITGERQWNGKAAIVGSSVTKVTLVNDITTNPPVRNTIRINDNLDVEDVAFAGIFDAVGFDASLSIINSVDAYLDNTLLGLRWQFLNHGNNSDAWVASIQGAMGNRDSTDSYSSSGNEASAKSKIKTTQAGLSLGHKFGTVAPYISYIHENHSVSTSVDNNSGSYNYDDSGVHTYYSLGVTSTAPTGFTFAVEYSHILIDWDRADLAKQDALAARVGFAW